MTKKILFLFFLTFSAGSFAQKTETLVVQTKNDCNHCKICETCGGKLETDLYYVRGIKLVTYNEENMTTTIEYKPKLITPDRIRQEIVKLGFDADDMPADPIAYARRDECCKPKK